MKRGIQITVMLALVFILCVCNSKAEIIWDSGHHEFSEGFEGEVWLLNDATADITGGWIGNLLCYDSSAVDVFETSEIDLIKPFDSSIAQIHTGTINKLFAVGSSNTTIYGGSLNVIQAVDTSEIFLYVSSYAWDPLGGSREGGLLTGFWLDSMNSFSIELQTEGVIDHLNFIPEPSTITIMAIGGLMLGYVNRKK